MDTPTISATVEPHTAAPVRIDRTVHLTASPAKVFTFVTDHAGMPAWVPGVRRVTVERFDDTEAGVVRTIRAPFGYRVASGRRSWPTTHPICSPTACVATRSSVTCDTLAHRCLTRSRSYGVYCRY